MPSKTLGDRVLDVEKVVGTLTYRLDYWDQRREEAYGAYRETERALSDHRARYERETLALQREIEDPKRQLSEHKEERKREKEEQKRQQEEWSRRKWSFGPNVVATLISIILGPLISAAVAYYIVGK